MRVGTFVFIGIANLVGTAVSLFGLASLLADDYQGLALPHLGAIGLPATIGCFVFSVTASVSARHWPKYAAAFIALLGIIGALMQSHSLEFERLFFRTYLITQAAAVLALAIAYLLDTRAQAKKRG